MERSSKEGRAADSRKGTSTSTLAKSTTPSRHSSSSHHSALPAHPRLHSIGRSVDSGAPHRTHVRGGPKQIPARVEGKTEEKSRQILPEKRGKPRGSAACSSAKSSDMNTPATSVFSPGATLSATTTSPQSKTSPSSEKGTANNLRLKALAAWVNERLKKSRMKKLQRSREEAWIAPAAMVLVLVIASSLVVYSRYSILSSAERFREDDRDVCVSADCQLHASYFRRRINTIINPCLDLHGYVCSRWAPNTAIASNLVGEMALSWTMRAARYLMKEPGSDRYLGNASLANAPGSISAVSDHGSVAAFLGKCIAQKDDDTDSLREVRQFAATIGIPWPYKDQQSAEGERAHPFTVLIHLDTLWGLELWSQTVVLKNIRGKDIPPMLVIRETGVAAGWLDLIDILENNGGRRAYYNEIHSLYGIPVPNETAISRHLSLERAVLTVLASTANETGREAVHTTVARLQSLFNNLKGYRLTETILSFFNTSGIHERSRVYVNSRRLLIAADWLLGMFGNRDLLRHTAWWFAQLCAVMASRKARVLIADSDAGSRMLKTARCMQVASAWFGPSLYYSSDAEYFTAEKRNIVDGFLRGLTEQVQRKLKAATWIDDRTRRVMEQRLRDLSVVAWLEQLERSDVPRLDQSSEAISNYWDNPKQEFLVSWIGAARHRLREKGPARLLREEEYWLASPVQGVLYGYLLNWVTVPHAALAWPLFYPQAGNGVLRAATYGGLATAFLDAALSMFDLRGIRIDEGERKAWMSPRSENQLYRRLRCSSGIDENLLQVASLRVAWDAYKNVSRDSTSVEKLGILDWSGSFQRYTPDQIFFLTYCLRFCNTDIHCSAAVRSLPDFGSVFGCGARPADDNDKNQCRFFA